MRFEPVSAQVCDQTGKIPLYAHARSLAKAVCGCRPEKDAPASAYEVMLCPELTRHIMLYVTVASTAILMEISNLHPEQFGLKASSISLAGSVFAWKSFLLSPQAKMSMYVQTYLLPEVAAHAAEVFYPDEEERNKAFIRPDMEKELAKGFITVYPIPEDWEVHLRRNNETRMECLHHTILISADAYTLYPLSRMLERYGAATLMPTDVHGVVTDQFEDTSQNPEMPPVAEPTFFYHAPDTPEHKVFEEAEAWYGDIRRRETSTITMACMPAMMQTRLLVTATENQWKNILNYGFIPWSAVSERMLPFYKSVMQACGPAVYAASNARVGFGKPVAHV